MSDTFYITTAIDYPNGTPHMGHAYEKIITDSYARWYKYLGKDTRFLTGTDENGQKLIESAKEKNQETMEYIDEQVVHFKKLCKDLNISNDDFIRTTEKRHSDVAQEFWTKLEEKGDIYFGSYSGMYCNNCETFYTELQAPDKNCPHHHGELTTKTEEGYFFKLSSYSDWIVEYLKANPSFVTPNKARNEILSRLEQEPLRDLAITRNNAGHGIVVPNKPEYIMYTWFDALINYYSALQTDDNLKKYWPADLHVIGKDITWFHSVIWPCMLNAIGIELPKQIYVHGMILAQDGRKMSKSLGNGVNPQDIISKYPLDTFRYYLLRSISATSDGLFSEKELIEKHNNELGNDFGNLIMRVIKLSLKIIDPKIDPEGVVQDINLEPTFEKMKEFMDKREHNKALDVLWEEVNKLNQYVNTTEPWKLKTEPEKLKHVVYNCLYGIHTIGCLLSAFIPDTAELTMKPLGAEIMSFDKLKFGEITYNLQTPDSLFPKIEIDK